MVARQIAALDIRPIQDFYNVKAYGVIGDGTTDDTAAIKALVRSAYAWATANLSPAQIYFPAGIYRIAGDNPLCDILVQNVSAVGGMVALHFIGEGHQNSVLRMDTTGASSARYIFNTPAGFSTIGGAAFIDLGFQGGPPDGDGGYAVSSIPTYANFFRLYGHNTAPSVQNQSVSFHRCAVSGFQTAFTFDGDAVASELTHVDCGYKFIRTAGYRINNGQSVNHRFFGCDFELIYGDIIQIGSAGGGSIQFFSGSLIMTADGTSTDRWVVNVPTAVTIDPIEIYAARMELRGNYSNLIHLANLTNGRVVLQGGRILDQAGAAKTHWLELGNYSRVDISEIQLDQANGFATNVALYGSGFGGETGTVLFDKCQLPTDFSDQCSINYVGNISSINSRSNPGQSGSAFVANDFTLNGAAALGLYTSWSSAGLSGDGSTASLQPRTKWTYLKAWPDYWPTSSGAEQTLKLPKNAIIKSIHVMYAGGGLNNFTANPTYLRVTNNDRTVLHAAVSVGTGGTAAQIHQNDYWYAVNTTVNARTLRLSFGPNSASASVYTGVTGSNAGGIALIEYL